MIVDFIRISLVILLTRGLVLAQLPVIVHDQFDDNHYGWYEQKTDRANVYFRNGKYMLEVPDDGWMTTVSPYMEEGRDFSIQATFRQTEGRSDNGYGLVWGYDGKGKLNSFLLTSGGYFRAQCFDPVVRGSGWTESRYIKPMGADNVLKVERRGARMNFYINGQLVQQTEAFPDAGPALGFVAYTEMTLQVDDFVFAHDIRINLSGESVPRVKKENLGPAINTAYDEVSPKISADGTTLYFGRKASPGNVGGINDQEDIWISKLRDGAWSRATNPGRPLNTTGTNNLIAVSTDQNTFLFHSPDGFTVMHRTGNGWTEREDLDIHFNNQSDHLEGCLSPDGKAILFVARLSTNAFYRRDVEERDIFVCLKRSDGTWSAPFNAGPVLNSAGNEYSPFLAADGRTLYFATNGRPGYGGVDIFMSRRLSDDWKHWSEPVNLGLGVNTVGFDAYYTIPAAGDYGYMVSNINAIGLADIVRFPIPDLLRPEPVVLVSGKVLNARTGKPLAASIRFDDLSAGMEVGEARVDPQTGDYDIALPAGRNYGFHAVAPGFLSLNENLELTDLEEYTEVKRDLLLVPIEVGETIQLNNVFFVRGTEVLLPESYPELDRLVRIMLDNPTIEIELSGHTDNVGSADANLALSEKRVQAVKNYLVARDVPSRRIAGQGYGGSQPIAPSDTEENRQRNRRVEFKIIKE